MNGIYLGPPPREVPWSLTLRLWFGGFGSFAWIWFGFGSALALVFLRSSDLTAAFDFRGPLARAPGVIERCEATGASEGSKSQSRPVYANHYRFAAPVAGGRPGVTATMRGISYATGVCLPEGTTVEVEHADGRPEISRIQGMRRGIFSAGVAFVLIFPVVGLALVGFSLRAGVKQARLLRIGRLARGRFLGDEATNVRINRRVVMKRRYQVETAAGTRHEIFIKTHQPERLSSPGDILLFYDPDDPGAALAWDLLPGHPRATATGELAPAGTLGTVLVLLPPLAAVVAHALVLSFS